MKSHYSWLRKALPAAVLVFSSMAAQADTMEVINGWGNKVLGTLENSAEAPDTYTGSFTGEYNNPLLVRYNERIYAPQESDSRTLAEWTSDFSLELIYYKDYSPYSFSISGTWGNTYSMEVCVNFDRAADRMTISRRGGTGGSGSGTGDEGDISGGSFSSTLPDALLAWKGNGYRPDGGANTLFYEELSPDWSSKAAPEYDMHVFLIGNGDFGAALSANRFGEILLNHKTSFTGGRPTAFNASNGAASNAKLGAYEKLGYVAIRDANESGDLKYVAELNMSKGVVSSMALRDKPVASEFFVSEPDDVFVSYLTSTEARSYEIQFSDGLAGTCTDGSHYMASKELESVTNTLAAVWDTDGEVTASGGAVKVAGATRLLVVIACASSFDMGATDFNSGRDLAADACATADAALAKGYEALYEAHVAEHSALYDACTLEFADMAPNTMSLDKLMEGGRKGTLSQAEWRLLETMIFNYGRYTLMGSSRKGNVLPSNLQGIWSNGPHWNSDIHADVNVEMNYWPAESTGLGDCHMAFLDYIIAMAGRPEWQGYAAARAPGCDPRAWCLGNANNIFGALEEFNSQYSEANAWFCNHLWQHYLYTLDREYLERIVPVMENACRFWEKKLAYGDDGLLYLPDSWSPENNSADSRAVHGRQLVTDLFTNTLAGARILGRYDYYDTMASILSELDNGIHVNGGALEEWRGVVPGADGHRHLSHLMCLFPLGQITPFDADAAPFNAAIRSLDLRGDDDGGEAAVWVDAWRANCRARTLQPNTSNGYKGAYENIVTAVTDSHLQLNLNSTTKQMHQIEGNAGLTSAMAEMLMQSYRAELTPDGDVCGHIHLLPALPAEWPAGSVSGLRAAGNFSVDMDWRGGELHSVSIVSHSGMPLRVQGTGVGRLFNIYAGGMNVTPRRGLAARAGEAQYISDDEIYFPATAVDGKIVVSRDAITTGVDEIAVDAATDAPAEYYNLQGMRVLHPEAGGIYIRRTAAGAVKVRY